MTKLTGVRNIEMIVHEASNLDTICYRGYAPLAHLAAVSQPDVFDQETNPEGLQRDLSPKHASEAYAYAQRPKVPEFPRAFPEVVLNVRSKRVIKLEELPETHNVVSGHDGVKLYRLSFDLNEMKDDDKVYVSRVDGNHRLYYAVGDERRDPLLKNAPFQIHIGLNREQERSLFVDINANQKGLNTSHLKIMQGKLTSEEIEIRDHLDRWISRKLVDDPMSPWHGMIHLGGSKKGTRQQGLTRAVNFTSLENGVNRTLSKSQYLHDLTQPPAKYVIIRNYWHAVKRVFAEEWANPKEFMVLKNIGVMSFSILGGTIIDKCLAREKVDIDDMIVYLQQVRTKFDWSKESEALAGMTGNRAALIIASELAVELTDDLGIGTKALEEKLLGVGAVADAT